MVMDNPVFYLDKISKLPVSPANPALFLPALYLYLKKKGRAQKKDL